MAKIDLSWEGSYNITRFDEELFQEFDRMIKHFNINLIYETGTFIGGTAARLATFGKEVRTVEFVKEQYEASKINLSSINNIKLFNDDSASFLDKDLVEGNEGILFFLDAHGFGGSLPLRSELDIIAKKKVKPPVIFIHDFKTNSRPNNGPNGGYDEGLTLEELEPLLTNIYGKYVYYFVENIGNGFKGTGIFFPKE